MSNEQKPPFLLSLVIGASIAAASATYAVAATKDGPGTWTVVDYVSRGPDLTARVLLNTRTGQVCEINRMLRPEPGNLWPADMSSPFWMCFAPPTPAGKVFLK